MTVDNGSIFKMCHCTLFAVRNNLEFLNNTHIAERFLILLFVSPGATFIPEGEKKSSGAHFVRYRLMVVKAARLNICNKNIP